MTTTPALDEKPECEHRSWTIVNGMVGPDHLKCDYCPATRKIGEWTEAGGHLHRDNWLAVAREAARFAADELEKTTSIHCPGHKFGNHSWICREAEGRIAELRGETK